MKKHGFPAFLCFLALNFILSLLIQSGYFMFAGSHPAEIAFSIIAFLSNTLMIYAVLLAVLLAPYFAGGGLGVFSAIFVCGQLTLVLDVVIYKIFRFHLNSMVFNLIFTPGGLKTLGQGPATQVLFFAIAAALLAAEIWFYRLAIRSAGRRDGFAGLLARRWGRVLSAALLIAAADKGLFAWGNLYDNPYTSGNAKLFPLYQPLKVRTFARKYFGVKLDAEVTVRINKKYSKLDYPARPLETVRPEKPLNILIVVVDSFRYDMLNPDVTPNLWGFSKKAAVFREHYSGGNCTRFGIFSILYGLYGNYWFSMLGERRGPVLIDVLREQGYDMRIFASAELSFPEFNKTCFVSVPRSDIYDKPEALTQYGRDAEITAKFLDYLGSRKKARPYFAFIFYDASHGSYEYPPGFEKFTPAGNSVNYLSLDKEKAVPLFNKYRNSIRFEDSLVGDILRRLEKSGGLKDTAVLVMGDHGEAFFEKGYHGHNRGYSAEEVKVPLVFYLPGRGPRVVDSPTGHMDIVPALMRLAGVKNPPSDYSNGDDIFSVTARPFIPVFSWDTSGLIKDGMALVMPLEVYKGGLTLYDRDYREVPGRKALDPLMPDLVYFQKEAKRFYR